MAEGPNTSKSMETVDNPKNDGLTENAEQTEKTHISEGDAALSPADSHACSSAKMAKRMEQRLRLKHLRAAKQPKKARRLLPLLQIRHR